MMTNYETATRSDVQHEKPCHDCPFARKALPGWLGDLSAEEWVRDLHDEVKIECHAIIGPQCAGAAIYRANVFKRCRSPEILRLPANRELVFSTHKEFLEHHKKK